MYVCICSGRWGAGGEWVPGTLASAALAAGGGFGWRAQWSGRLGCELIGYGGLGLAGLVSCKVHAGTCFCS